MSKDTLCRNTFKDIKYDQNVILKQVRNKVKTPDY